YLLYMARRPPTPPLFPYTTLFRSLCARGQPTCVADRALPLQGDRSADGAAGDKRHARPHARRPRLVDGAGAATGPGGGQGPGLLDRKSTRLNSSHEWISYAVFCLK